MLGIGRIDLSARRVAWRFAVPLIVLGAFLLLGSPARALFSNSTTISVDGVMASQPRIVTDSQSNALAVWTEDDSGTQRVQAAFRPAGGDFQTLGYISGSGAIADQPVVTFDEHDNALVVWTTYEGAFGAVQAAFRPAGGVFGAPQTISAGEADVSYYDPHVDLDESGTVVWTRETAEGNLSVQASFRPKDGSFGAPQTLSGAGNAFEQQVVIDERGNSLAVWTEESAGAPAVMSASRPRTGNWSAPAPVSPAGFDAFSPRVAVDSRNNVIAVWTADADGANNNDPNFIQSALRPEGGQFGNAESISSESSGFASEPQVVFDEDDNALVAWSRDDGSNTRIEASFHPKGGSFSVPQTLSAAGENAFEPQVAVDESAAVVWTIDNGSSLRVQGAFRHKDGTFGGAQTLSDPGDDSFEPALAMDKGGNVLALWTRNELANFPVVQFSYRQRTASFTEPSALSAPAPAGAFQPQVATDCWNNALAVWTVDTDVNDPDNPTWVEASFARAGGQFGAPVRLSEPSTNAFQPHVAFESDGDAVITWTGTDTSGNQRVYATFRPAGNGYISPITLSPPGSDAFDPQVSGGRGSVVVWSRIAGANVTAEAAVKPEDESFLPFDTISPAGEDASSPQIAVGKEGTAVATWFAGAGDGVSAAIGRTSPAGFDPAALLSDPGMAASEPHAAVDDRGAAVVIWTGGEGAFIQYAFRARDAAFGAAQNIASDNVFEPQVAFDESGNALAAWTRFLNGVGQIETASRPRDGAFSAGVTISDTGEPLDNFGPQIAADDSATVVWTASTASGFLRVQSSFKPVDGAFGPVQTLTDRLLYAFEPRVAIDERGNATAVWTLTDTVDPNLPSAPSAIQSAFRPRV